MHHTGILEHACVITAHTHVPWEPFQVSARESGNGNTPGGCKGYEGFWGLTFIRSFYPPFKQKGITYRNNFFLKYKVLIEKLQVYYNFFFPELFVNKLPTWCPITPEYFNVCFLNAIIFSHVATIELKIKRISTLLPLNPHAALTFALKMSFKTKESTSEPPVALSIIFLYFPLS